MIAYIINPHIVLYCTAYDLYHKLEMRYIE